jgi:selenium metabolism protein YedF
MDMEIYVDARGKACPQPVLMTKKALESMDEGRVITAVDNDIARENVEKLVKSKNLNYFINKKSSAIEITIDKGSGAEVTIPVTVKESLEANTLIDGPYAVMLAKDTFGDGARELGKLLLKNYLYTLLEMDLPPSSLLFVNSGVNLTTEGSDVIDILKHLEEKGVEILSCGTCLDYYHLKDKLSVGRVTNMYEIAEKTTKIRTVSL